VIVTEPTASGHHDLERITGLSNHFHIPMAVIVNKCDLNPEMTRRIRWDCIESNIPVIAEFPFDPVFVNAMVNGQAVSEFSEHEYGPSILETWDQILSLIEASQAVEAS
jgi:MinD superfamily P-loop ATPase